MPKGKRIGSFADGFELIKQTVWVCPKHGEVDGWNDIPTPRGHWHKGCGEWLERRERLASAPPFRGTDG